MKSASPIRCGLAVAMLLGGAFRLDAQAAESAPAKPSATVSALPSAQPTGAAAPPAAAAPAPPPVHHVDVTYADGKLAVEATNASLNEILLDVARKTGMKISGGVADDRVFGSYGPSAPAQVLDALLEGTGSNILLVDGPKGESELILTPRHGGATPPNPNAAQSNDSEEQSAGGGYVPPLRPFRPPMNNGRGPIAPGPDTQSIVPGGFADTDGGESSGPKTPQQIYDQLQRSMQQQQNQPPPPPQ